MKRKPISNFIKGFFTDSLWSIAGLVLMNVAAQFAVYPVWNRQLGSEVYGNIIFMISVMNIVTVSLGGSCNYARMRNSVDGVTGNRPYLLALILGSTAALPLVCSLKLLGVFTLSWTETALFCLLLCATLWRTYADVEYRLSLNYKGYFRYYLCITLGYLAGIGLFLWSGLWPLALLPGEIAGLLMVICRGSVFKRDKIAVPSQEIFRLILVLLGGNFLSNLIFNADRLLLKFLLGGTAVTVYYLASLLGKTMTLVTMPLNSVLIGYFSRYTGRFTRSMVHKITLISFGAAALAAIACTLGSYILIPLLYPADYAAAKEFFLIANLSQIFYFISTVITNSVLLRFARARYQLYVNLCYAVLFCGLCIPLAMAAGMSGFCTGLLITCAARLIFSLLLCYHDAEKE